MADPTFTRQLATIVAIDAVGYSRLMSADEETALAAFEERRDLICARCEAHGGRMFGAAGDSIMAEFGAAVDALLAVQDFQSRLADLNRDAADARRMGFRAGLHTGDVIVRGDFLFGDDVNIAARVQEWAPAGGVALSDTTWHHVKDRTAAAFTDLGPFRLKNIAFPVRIRIGAPAGQTALSFRGEELNGERDRPAALAGPPAVAVLPLRCEPDLAFMADGVAEDIIHGLSATRWLAVIARSSSFQFRDEKLGGRLVGRALGARYLVSGTLAREGRALRVSVSLEDSTDGRLLWSRRLDCRPDEMAGLHEQIGAEIVAPLEKEVDRVEQARTFHVPWESLETWQLVRRGRWHMGRRTRRDTELALACFDEAYRIDAGSSAVLNELSWWYFWRAWLRFGDKDDLDRVARFARRALDMDSTDARPYAHLGAVAIMRGRAAEATEHLERALYLNPSFAFARSALGSARVLLGDGAGAAPCFREAERLSPFDIYGFHNLGELAVALSLVGDWPGVIEAADRSLELSPGYFYSRFLKVGALAQLGRLAEAKAERAVFDTRHPDFAARKVRWIPFADPTITERLVAGFALSGPVRESEGPV